MPLERVTEAGPRSCTKGRELPRFLADNLLPALLFAAAAGARAVGVFEDIRRLPEADTALWVVRLLEVAGSVLVVLFCGLVAMLLLDREPRRGSRAGPTAVAVALAGTLLMNGVLVHPPTTEDWRVVALADGLIAAGLAFSVYAASSLGRCFGVAPEARGLVTTGAYRLVRHPLYFGEAIAALGALLAVLAPPTALVYGAFCACQAMRARLEERALTATFPAYAEYRRRTPALLPWPRPQPRS